MSEFFETNSKRGIPPELSGRLRDRLDVIDAAATLKDIALPNFGLDELKGDRAGTWAVKVNKNLRLTFAFADGDASEVNFLCQAQTDCRVGEKLGGSNSLEEVLM